MPYEEIPSDEQVTATLAGLGGQATAQELCNALVEAGHPRRDSQLAIQRTTERGGIAVQSDWTLSLVTEDAAA